MFNLFSRKKSKSKNIFKLIFHIDNDSIETIINHNDYSDDSANQIAIMLYAINNGLLFNAIIKSLQDKNNIDEHFINLILNKLNHYYTLNNNTAIIKPLETFQKNVKS
jgi:hypothetical protein